MKTRVQIALTACLVSLIAYAYLTMHYYPLKFGMAAGQSICNVSEKLNCDAVAASSYSAFLGIPVSIWGGAATAVLFFLILLGWLEWTDNPERTRRWAVLLSGLSLIASVVMATISAVFLHNYCLFCIALYALSAITFFVYRGVLREPFWMHFKLDLPRLWTESRGILFAYLAIPVLAVLTHYSFVQDFSDTKIQRMVDEVISAWEAAPKNEFVAKPSLATGPSPETASMTLVEFADFRCGHCKHASYTLDAFVKAHSDVRFEFYAFPLDGSCNDKIESKSGLSCRLAESVYCAEKDGKGWAMHHALYDTQDEVNRTGSVNELDVILGREAAQLGLNWESLQRCMVDPATVDAIRAQAKQGALVNVQGTPTIFANGRQLQAGQLIPVLSAAREKSLQNKAH